MDHNDLRDAVVALRAVPGSDWGDMDDPLAALRTLRGKDDELH